MVVAGTDPGSVAKYRKTMNNQKRRIRRRHTVGGTKDFAEWEAVINAENEAKRSALRMATTQGHEDPNIQVRSLTHSLWPFWTTFFLATRYCKAEFSRQLLTSTWIFVSGSLRRDREKTVSYLNLST